MLEVRYYKTISLSKYFAIQLLVLVICLFCDGVSLGHASEGLRALVGTHLEAGGVSYLFLKFEV